MGDSDATSPSSSPPSQPQPSRPWFAPDRILALATLALVGTAIWQHFDTVDAVRATNRLVEASENTAANTRRTASADLVMKIDAILDQPRFDKSTDDIQSHNSYFQHSVTSNGSPKNISLFITPATPLFQSSRRATVPASRLASTKLGVTLGDAKFAKLVAGFKTFRHQL